MEELAIAVAFSGPLTAAIFTFGPRLLNGRKKNDKSGNPHGDPDEMLIGDCTVRWFKTEFKKVVVDAIKEANRNRS